MKLCETTTRDFAEATQAIGGAYSQACSHRASALDLLLQAGQLLDQVKDVLPHGEWLLWLKAYQEQLGFGERTAQRLLYLARNTSSTSDLTDEQQAAALRIVWGNEPTDTDARPSLDRFSLFARWIADHRACEFPVSDPAVLAQQIHAARRWLDELESQLLTARTA